MTPDNYRCAGRVAIKEGEEGEHKQENAEQEQRTWCVTRQPAVSCGAADVAVLYITAIERITKSTGKRHCSQSLTFNIGTN
jgi:hypothetical protein